ncbi:hypothetical protein LEM8419_01382 [Neolewinella maritima]|uniref:VCBS repeat-containing protein n=1 Tax=Neolewinella maritima TaxID=1383882 RepID=A0ABM9B0C1_9BACT|nr:VCBS repeat-containing protein [Neolewinella maritima]CAH1000233.1 hypothetical protein LEM8419_01382 [Neolewinella maritima]
MTKVYYRYALLLALSYLLLACGNPADDFRRGYADAGTARSADSDDTEQLPTDRWTYIEVDSAKTMWGDYDSPDWLRYFGLAAGDLNGDGYLDIVTGRNVYLNAGDSMTGSWRKLDLGRNVDANLIIDYQDRPAILAEALPDVVLFTGNADGTDWTEQRIVAQVPATGHHNGQGYKVADVFAEHGDEEVIYASLGGLYILDPSTPEPWTVTLAGKDASDEGFGVADIDGDGDLDLISGFRTEGGDPEVPTVVVWFENPGTITPNWTRHEIGTTVHATDRVEAADLNGDGKTDVVVAEERYPGLEPDASLFAYLQQDTGWVRTKVVTQYSMNNLSLPDLNQDGYADIVTSEHKGPGLSLQVWLNDGGANFTRQEIDGGKESHLGAQPYDLDGDGDLDLISIGWDQHQYVHVWRNDAIQ